MAEQPRKWWQVTAQVGCSLLLWGLIIAGCAGIFSCDQRERQVRFDNEWNLKTSIIKANDGQFKILHTYPSHNNKGHFTGHVVVAEGVKTGMRIEVSPHPLLPVPGEVWQVEAQSTSNSWVAFQFVKKLR